MTTIFKEAGESFLRSFAAALAVFLPGLLAAPDLNNVKALALAGLLSAVVAGIKSIQIFVPQLSWSSLIPNVLLANIADSFTRAFLGTFITLVTNGLDVISVVNLSTVKDVVVAALVGALAAAIRAIQAWLTTGEQPQPTKGLKV